MNLTVQMFEAQVAYYLNLYLGKYVEGLDADSLKISVWKGDVELRNLRHVEVGCPFDDPLTHACGVHAASSPRRWRSSSCP